MEASKYLKKPLLPAPRNQNLEKHECTFDIQALEELTTWISSIPMTMLGLKYDGY